MQRQYELMFIIRADLDEEGHDGVVEQVTQILANLGGEVTVTDPRGKRKLAYPIRKQREGFYVRMEMEFPKDSIRELERSLRLTEPVLRHLVVRMDE